MNQAQAMTALSALGQETRLETFRLLVTACCRGLTAGEIGEKTGAVQNTLSTHLATLSQAGLITSKREGRSIRYFADLDGMRGLLGYLMDDCCAGRAGRSTSDDSGEACCDAKPQLAANCC